MKPTNIILRLAAAFCLLAVVFAIVGWQGISHLRHLNAQMQNLIYGRWEVERQIHQAYSLSSQNSEVVALIFLESDPVRIQRLLVQRAANSARISELLSALQPNLETEKEKELLAVVESHRGPYVESYKRALALLLSGHNYDEARKMMADTVRPALVTYGDAWNVLDQNEAKEIEVIIQQSKSDFTIGQRNLFVTLFFAGMIAVAIAVITVLRVKEEIALRYRMEESLQQARLELEARVVERTAELAKSNQALQMENGERKLAQEELGWKTAFLEAQVNSSIDGILVVDDARNTALQNQRFIDLFKIPQDLADSEVDQSRLRCVTNSVRFPEPFLQRISFLYEHPNEVSFDEIELKNGTILDRYSCPAVGKDGKYYGRIWTFRDITARKRAEESLRLLGSAVEQSKESVTITEADLELPGPKIVFVNSAFTKMTGYTATEIIGKTPRILQGPRTDKAVLSRLRRNLQQGETFEGEAINYRKDGTEFNLEWQITPLRDSNNKITHFVATQRDVTERRTFEARLFQSQKLETVGKLAGGIAHEFNSILTAIIGQSELLLQDLPNASPLAKNVTEISVAAHRAASLTQQLLAYGRKQFLRPTTLDLNQVVLDMRSVFTHLTQGKVDVQIVPAREPQFVQVDAGQLEQVIMNVAMNAADAMPNGGKLTLETATVTLEEAYVSRFPELKAGEYAMLAITDTGMGITEAVKARLFEPFFTTKAIGHGTGLGLSTCYGILKQSGGHISVYSEPSRGATFKIYLPRAESAAPIPTPRLNGLGLPHGAETILLVEDDPALREMAATLLKRLGYKVLTAADGFEALNLRQEATAGHIDLLFTDVVLPHMSGRELADRIQSLYPHTKILFTSAYTENAILHQGLLNKGVALLQKPFTPSALAKKVREVLDQFISTA